MQHLFDQALKQHQAGHLQQAEQLYRQILWSQPRHFDALHMLGVVAHQVGRYDRAVEYIRMALAENPAIASAYYNLGTALQAQGNLDEAIANYRHALDLKPEYPQAHNNLGNALKLQGKLDGAITHYQQAVRLQPAQVDAHYNLANVLQDRGKHAEALASYQQVLRLKPDDVIAHDNLILLMQYHPDCDAAAICQEARRWNDQHAEPLAKYRQPHANSRDPARRLRIGYVSPEFWNHAGAFFLMPLLSNHDRNQVEVYCYAEVARPDDVTDRLRAHADVWRSTVGLTDEQMADLVRKDGIDILIDLALHTGFNRLLVFARKPAPVQVTWLGYPGTTGLSTIDYRLTDPYLDPPGETDACYCERSVRLPETFWCYDPLSDEPPVNDLPALANGWITFGSLNTFKKLNDGAVLLWAKVLDAVPQSRLMLLAPAGPSREHIVALLGQQGIDESRLEFVDRQPRQAYLQMYHRIDIGLDPLPYNGHTTSLDAFWMGVPTITQIGKSVVGRAGWSQLCNLGLPELAARTPDEYVAKAAQLAGDLPGLQQLRATLRARMRASPLMDGKRFACHMEEAYRQMWHTWCQTRDADGKPR
jgi:predicted O-linked N-acetylglucosamine transferase (SPINDLY family)